MSRGRAALAFAAGSLVAFATVPAGALLWLARATPDRLLLPELLAGAVLLVALVAGAVALVLGRRARGLGARRTVLLAVPLTAAPAALLPRLAAGGPGRFLAVAAALAFAPAWVLLLERTLARRP